MAQHDMVIANASGATVRGDINDALEALASLSGGASAPSTTYPGQLWADTTTSLLKMRNTVNSAWVTIGVLDQSYLGLTYAAQGLLSGLTLSNSAGDATNDIDVDAGEASSNDAAVADRVPMVLASALTKRLDAAWAVGTGNGGLDTGSAANTTYHVYLIKRTDTGVVDVLFSTNATTPTMPSSYTKKRRIGSFIRASGAILGFIQTGNIFRLKSPATDFNSTNVGTARVSYTVTVPAGIKFLWMGMIFVIQAGAPSVEGVLLTDPDGTDVAPSGVLCSLYAGAGGGIVQASCVTNTSSQIGARAQYGDADSSLGISTLGWVDERRT